MNQAFITSISPMQRLTEMQQNKGVGGVKGEFQNIFEETISEVVNTQKELESQQYLLATGQLEDGHTLSIAAAQASLSVDLLVQLRNKAVESYNEIMRMSV